MQENEIIPRIKALCEARSWTFYRLAKESGITYSTLCTMLHKSGAPSIPTLIKICNAFDITLSQFFDEGDSYAFLSESEKNHLIRWKQLTSDNQKDAEKYMAFLLSEQSK